MSAKTYNCPSCGAPITFTSSIAVSIVCTYCRSLVIRRDLNLEALGKVAQLPPDVSPLQLGTTGEIDGVKFQLVGRVRWQWELGSWTEWYAELGGGTGKRWLAETQGFYTFTAPIAGTTPPPIRALKAGKTVRIAGKELTVVDIKESVCSAAEGELPEVIPAGMKRLSADLQGSGQEFAGIEETASGVTLFSGRYTEFADCNFANLRPVPGWSRGEDAVAAPGGTTSFSCPSCGAPVVIRASGLSMSAVCGSCQTIVDAGDENHRILEKAHENVGGATALAIGARGTLQGTAYEVIGFVARKDDYSEWHEYLLFNPWRGFDWLVTYNGHWAFIERMLSTPQSDGTHVRDGDHTLKFFSAYTSEIVRVLGEFYWQTHRGEKTLVKDFIAPPHVMSSETYPGLSETTWSRGTYVDHKVIAAAFNTKLARPDGIWLNQPNPYRERARGLAGVATLAVLLLVALQAYGVVSRPLIELTRVEDVMPAKAAGRVFSSEPFTVTGASSRVEVDGTAWVSNQWGSFDLTLVEESTNVTYDADLDIEYYSGTDSDGAWSEGSPERSTAFSAVEPGRYRLLIEPTADPAMSELHFAMVVRQGGLFWSAFVYALFLILVYPIWLAIRSARFESRRWADSDMATTSGDDGDA